MSPDDPDLIVVGGGSAGCVVAARASEDRSRRVLLLEAGGESDRAEIRVPAGFFRLFRSEVDWAFETEPEAEVDGRRLYWPRGKVLGGSSSINAMIYIRGHRSDFEHWGAVAGPRWGWPAVLARFRRSEDQARGGSEHHGVGGPLPVADPRSPRKLSRLWVEAAVDWGMPRNPDFNGPTQEGAGLYQVTQRRGERWSAERAFLAPARGRPNLEVRTGCEVRRLLIEGGRVVGVEYRRGGRTERVHADETVLSAGAVGSPAILLRSGVGPAAGLEAAGVPVAHDLPGVGADLQDHPAVPLTWAVNSSDTLAKAEYSILEKLRWALLRRGMLTSNVAEGGGFLRLRDDAPAPEVQFHFAPAFLLDHGFRNPKGNGITCGVTLVRPRSRGRIRLRPGDPEAPPAIEPGYFTEAADLDDLVAGMRVGREIVTGGVFGSLLGAAHRPRVEKRSDASLRSHARRWGQTLYHPTSTCRMGRDDDAVVDPELRVRGLKGVRIADASVMPRIVNGNTNAAAIMIGEAAAEILGGASESFGPHPSGRR